MRSKEEKKVKNAPGCAKKEVLHPTEIGRGKKTEKVKNAQRCVKKEVLRPTEI